MDRIIQAIQFDDRNIADIFKLPCVSSIRKSFPRQVFATVCCGDSCKRVVRKGDWIVETRKNGWRVFTSKEYQQFKK